jgi:hypothetical protein
LGGGCWRGNRRCFFEFKYLNRAALANTGGSQSPSSGPFPLAVIAEPRCPCLIRNETLAKHNRVLSISQPIQSMMMRMMMLPSFVVGLSRQKTYFADTTAPCVENDGFDGPALCFFLVHKKTTHQRHIPRPKTPSLNLLFNSLIHSGLNSPLEENLRSIQMATVSQWYQKSIA